MFFKVTKLLIAFVIARHILGWVYLMGFHKTPSNHWPGPCRAVSPVEHGAEDMVLTKSGLVIITSGIDVTYRGDDTDPRITDAEGKLYAFDMTTPSGNATELKLEVDFDFSPHGISIWESDEGETRLFVINHRLEAEAVEIFKLSGTLAKPVVEHVKTIQDPLFTSMNDVLATGPDSFYVSNDGYLRFTMWRGLERLLNFFWGSIVHYDGEDARTVIGSLFEPNGMALSLDGNFVYASLPFYSCIGVYARDKETNGLTLLRKIVLGNIADNPWVHPITGDIWYGAVPIVYRTLAAFTDFDAAAPSMAVRVRSLSSEDRPFEEYKTYDVFLDNGHLMSTSSSAVAYGNHLLVGSVVQKLVYCEMKTETTISRDIY